MITQPAEFEVSLILKRQSSGEIAELTMRPQDAQEKNRQDPA